jgi:4-aminobutyrate aminotransferase-like enzyme
MQSQRILKLLRSFESRNVTFIEPDGTWPLVWEKARGNYVWDVDGRKYVDLTAAFGVAAAGHANPRVVRAAKEQMSRLMHAMGDVHPHPLKAKLARELSRITFERWDSGARGKSIFCNSGFEAVETALKTAVLATGKPHVIAFTGGYHGLGYGALSITHRKMFRKPFHAQLAQFGHFVTYPHEHGSTLPAVTDEIETLFRTRRIGAIIVEPVQGRGGINIPDPGLLPALRELCDRHKALLIVDEVFTGFGRTGRWFACEHSGAVPDLICLGKALTGGFPLSACVGKSEVMDAWPPSKGEALHTSTFLGHPVGCAMALANIEAIGSGKLLEKSRRLGDSLLERLQSLSSKNLKLSCRGLGLMAGVELHKRNGVPATAEAFRVVKAMLQRGFIMLPEGEHGNVLSFTPPLTITERLLDDAVQNLAQTLRAA